MGPEFDPSNRRSTPVSYPMQEQVLRMLESGMRPVAIASALSIPPNQVYWVARKNGIRFTRENLSEEEKEEVRRLREIEGLPIRTVAHAMGRSKSSIGEWARRRFVQVQNEGGSGPELLKVPKRCPRHGLVRLWPCVACQADPI